MRTIQLTDGDGPVYVNVDRIVWFQTDKGNDHKYPTTLATAGGGVLAGGAVIFRIKETPAEINNALRNLADR